MSDLLEMKESLLRNNKGRIEPNMVLFSSKIWQLRLNRILVVGSRLDNFLELDNFTEHTRLCPHCGQNWTGRELERQINSGLYERLLLSNDKKAVLEIARKERNPEQPSEIMKDPMHDPSSFEYNGTWLLVLDESKVKAVMRYRGKNAFGAKVKSEITGYFSDNGKLLEYSFE